MPSHESFADWTSPTRLAPLVIASGALSLMYWNGPSDEPLRSGWGGKLFGSTCASCASALWMSGTSGWAASTSAPQLSNSENEPTNANTLLTSSSVIVLFVPQLNWSSPAVIFSCRPNTPPWLFW